MDQYICKIASREELEKRPNRNLYEILFDMPGLIVDKHMDHKTGKMQLSVMSNRGHSAIPKTGADGNAILVTVPLIIDGSRISDTEQYLSILEMVV